MSASQIRPSAAWYLLPVLLALLSALLVPLAIFRVVANKNVLAVQFKAPGAKEFEIPSPGKYVLWNETETMFEGKTYSSSSTLPAGMQFELLDLDSKTPVQMTADASTTLSSGSTSRRSVGTFEISHPGKYHVSVNGQFPDRIFYFRESLWRQMGSITRAVPLSLTGLLLAAGLSVYIFLRRRAARTEL